MCSASEKAGHSKSSKQVSEARPRDNGGQKRDGLAFPRGRVLLCSEQNNGLTNNNHLLVSSSESTVTYLILSSRVVADPRVSAQLSP